MLQLPVPRRPATSQLAEEDEEPVSSRIHELPPADLPPAAAPPEPVVAPEPAVAPAGADKPAADAS